MSRSGYSDDCENLGLYRQAVDRAIAGKRGQAFLRELAQTLDAMPVKELARDTFGKVDGPVCTLGAVAAARKMDMSRLDAECRERLGEHFGIARSLACEIMFENDEHDTWSWSAKNETPAERWKRMREWVEEHLIPPSPEVIAKRLARFNSR